jgi:hypothetical protein
MMVKNCFLRLCGGRRNLLCVSKVCMVVDWWGDGICERDKTLCVEQV